MTKIIEYEQIEVPASEEARYSSEGCNKYGMRKDHDSVYVKLRRPIKSRRRNEQRQQNV
jgi:hypothetical protein